MFGVNSCVKVPLRDVHVHFDCPGSHKVQAPVGLGLNFSWQAQYFVDFGKKVAETRNLLVTLCVCVGSLGLWRGDNLISLSRNPLGTLCRSDRSRCSALRILTWLAQPSPYIVCVGSLSLWCAVNFDMAPSTFS